MFFFQQSQGLVQVHEGRRQPVGGGHEEALPDRWRVARRQAGAQVLDDGPQCAVQDPHVHRQSNESTENVTPSASGVVVTCDTLTAVLCTRTVRFSLEVLVYTKLAVMLLQCARVLFNCCDTWPAIQYYVVPSWRYACTCRKQIHCLICINWRWQWRGLLACSILFIVHHRLHYMY